MTTPIDITCTYRSIDPSPAVESAVRSWVARLELCYDRIEHCSVVFEIPHRRHRQGKTFSVHVQLMVPGRTIAVSRGVRDHSHENLYAALSDAFRAARRQLQDHVRIRRREVKTHPEYARFAAALG